jgi:hypothetical protein
MFPACVKPSDVREEVDPNGLLMTVLGVPVTKSKADGEDLYCAAQNGATDPHTSFANHLRVNEPPRNGHLFAYKYGNGHRPLTKAAFIARLHKAFRAANLEPLQGHGIRIGSTLFYLLRGTPFDVVKTIGRWSSDAFLLYLRKHAQIMAPYMQANPQLHTEFMRISMPPVCCESSLLAPLGILRGCVVNSLLTGYPRRTHIVPGNHVTSGFRPPISSHYTS